ncbi:emp24/gp25L/p24 family/GOLD-domain-containing protein [Blakeslea trispora]|nr:emp24/gp25L/p24 family/GOLD-domain-containing protein [Blakeslea trispora]
MSNKVVLLVVALVCLLKTALAVNIDIPAHENECFYEELNYGDRLSLTYQVGEGGDYDIDFWVSDPQNNVVLSNSREDSGHFTVTATMPGKHLYCFSNKMSSVAAKSVNFNAHVNPKNSVDDTNHEDPLRNEIEELAESILNIKAEQEYIIAREQRHRDTAESTNTRVKWWSIAQIGLLISVCAWQVHYIKHFFEVKRTV